MAQWRQGYSQTNVDGQQVTVNYHSQTDNEQPQFNRDAIAEFVVVANRFDATQGRSAGMIVNAISKSGTNTFAGSAGGYFRSDNFNAKDFVEDRVLPYSNQQLSGTFGGPIVRDKVHFFGSYGFERQPQTFAYDSPYPSFNVDQQFTAKTHTMLSRLDYQFTPRSRLSVRASLWNTLFYQGGGATNHPSNGGTRRRVAPQYFATFTQVLSNRSVNEIKGGIANYDRENQPNVRWQGGDFPYHPVGTGSSVVVNLRGYTIGGSAVYPSQDTVVGYFESSPLPLGGRVALDGMFEVFNLFNHANYGSYVTNESNARFGQPEFDENVQYFPRMLQLGFRMTF